MPTKKTTAGSKKSYYGKRPLWHWVLFYIVIGVVVYGLVYYFVFSKNGKGFQYNYSSPSTQQQNY